MDIANLTRYSLCVEKIQGANVPSLCPVTSGRWVKFDDIMDASLNSPASPVQQPQDRHSSEYSDGSRSVSEFMGDDERCWGYDGDAL